LAQTEAKRELTQEKFTKFLEWLSPVTEKAGEEYERLRFRLMTFFSRRRCRFPEELADETINRVVLKVEGDEIENKLAYCYGVARNIFLESLRKDKKHENIDEIQIEAENIEQDDSPYQDCLDECLEKLPNENRHLVLDYFSESKQAKIEKHKEMSDALEISKTALRMKILRIKKKLQICVEKCLAC
jgi:DNA-directed RNA polymerase specialized sigma24 family protein